MILSPEKALTHFERLKIQNRLGHFYLIKTEGELDSFFQDLIPKISSPKNLATKISRQFDWSNHPDVCTIETQNFKSQTEINEEIQSFLGRASFEFSERIVILKCAQLLSENTQQKLLIDLESPPTPTLFFLIIPPWGKLLATVESRAQVLTIKTKENKSAKYSSSIIEQVRHSQNQEELYHWIKTEFEQKDFDEEKTLALLIDDLIATKINFRDCDHFLQILKQAKNSQTVHNPVILRFLPAFIAYKNARA